MLEQDHSQVDATDGTQIGVYHCGGGDAPFMLTNGLGGSFNAWQHIIQYFQDEHSIWSWDYRGLYRSGPPASPDLGMKIHARDLLAVMDANNIESAVHMGWSMGVQVLLEFYRLAPERIDGLILIGGAAGRPFDTAFGGGPRSKWVLPIIEKLHKYEPLFGGLIPMATPLTVLIPWLRLTGLVAPTVDDKLVTQIANDFLQLDFDLYLQTLKALGEHDATDLLPLIDLPTLIIVGTKDLATPPEASMRLHQGIANSELLEVRGGTHYLPVEFPELINLRIAKFLSERVY
jgi:pimeloyl-ACP methyl ester carboxylesterase